MANKYTINKRIIMLVFGVVSMLFAGVIYAWSILKAPLAEAFAWSPSELALCFTLTMCFFCLGGLFGSFISKKIGVKLSVIIFGAVAGTGLALTGLSQGEVLLLYVTYSIMAGGGIGVIYNVVISTVSAWFPDKAGLCSGALMMGFGLSALIIGNIADKLFSLTAVGFRATYVLLGLLVVVVHIFVGLFIRRPDKLAKKESDAEKNDNTNSNDLDKGMTPGEMLSRSSFWRGFILLICLTAVGSSVISFARDLAISVGAENSLATTLVGVLSVCNGLGRIITGRCFDTVGRRKTMIFANAVTILAAAATLLSVYISSLPLLIIGLCLTGMSYGSSPTISSAFTSAFYGRKHFATNFSIMNFNLVLASFVATACTALLTLSGGYTAPFILLLILSMVSLALNLSIKKP